ncbi:M3 family oligoendopeptidase [Streptomyces agglomeratus]|uniref:M3 family oligoendopeptidase n=1 Tax=Streptomyces agglomeratus TaxID=285458 RepID=UPI00099F67C3|nr:M3 family oligoendopeptidase [Streptomyces agglomeratus]
MSAQWDLSHLLPSSREPAVGVHSLLSLAEAAAGELAVHRGRVAAFSGAELVCFMQKLAEVRDLLGRARWYAALRLSEDVADDERLALDQCVNERATAVDSRLLFFDVEWAAVPAEVAEELLRTDSLDFCGHHLRRLRVNRPHLLPEAAERALAEKAVVGARAWEHLFDELVGAMEVADGTATQSLDSALSRMSSADRTERRRVADALTAAFVPQLRTRAFTYGTILRDAAIEDRLRGRSHWRARRNAENQVSEASVQALLDAVSSRYDLVRRWYRLKARLLGVQRLAHYDRSAPIGSASRAVSWQEARETVLDAYAAFSPQLERAARRFFVENWVDARTGPRRRQGASCEYTVPSVHPYVRVNWQGRAPDVLTLGHEIGHGVHGLLAAPCGIFHQHAPVTLAETAAVFGETLVLRRFEAMATLPAHQLDVLAASLDGAASIVFRQTALSRFEERAHRAARERGTLSADDFADFWIDTQSEMFGTSVDIDDDYRPWWSYISHFVGVPGYLYSYVFGHLLGLALHHRYIQGDTSIPALYVRLLEAGGSAAPNNLLHAVGIDTESGTVWNEGLDLIEQQLRAAEQMSSLVTDRSAAR